MASKPVSFKSRIASIIAALPLVAGIAGSASPSAHAAEPWPGQIQAVYRVEFNGFDIGTFEFNANVNGATYALTGDAKISALLGAFRWQGATRASGALAGDAPKPAGYTFDFATSSKTGSIKMGFAAENVTSLAHVPPYFQPPGIINVREQHLKGVLDPLSAVMAISRSDNANPCGRRLSVFDGKQRFDLMLSFRRQERISEQRPSGQPGVAYVCKVKYTPIAGHKVSEETRALAMSNDIEISLRPVPSANLFIPHSITIPTGAGTARLTAQSVRIVTRSEQIALGN